MVAMDMERMRHHALISYIPNHDLLLVFAEIDDTLIVLRPIDREVGHAHHRRSLNLEIHCGGTARKPNGVARKRCRDGGNRIGSWGDYIDLQETEGDVVERAYRVAHHWRSTRIACR